MERAGLGLRRQLPNLGTGEECGNHLVQAGVAYRGHPDSVLHLNSLALAGGASFLPDRRRKDVGRGGQGARCRGG